MTLRIAKTLAGGVAGAALALACAQAGPASAAAGGGPAIIDWTIDGAFSDGGVFFGTFTYDGFTDSVTKWDVTTTTPTTDPDYTTHFGFALVIPPGGVDFGVPIDPDAEDEFHVFFPIHEIVVTHDLTGNEVQIVGGDAISVIHTITSGTAVGVAAAPEPAVWSMLILGFGIAGGALRRRGRLDIA